MARPELREYDAKRGRSAPPDEMTAAGSRAFRLAFAIGLALLSLGGSPASAERLVVLSDLNGSYGSTEYDARIDAAVARTLELRPDAVLIAGDMVAGQRRRPLSRGELLAMWGAFHGRVTGPLREAGLTTIVVPGNHDASAYPGFETEREVFAEQWRERLQGVERIGEGRFPFFYATAVGDVLVIALDATLPGRLPSVQYEFLESLLKAHGNAYRWRLVLTHLPLWPYSRGREREILRDERLEADLRRHDVSLVVSGHHHAFFAGHAPDGILHVSNGSLGGGVRPLVGESVSRPYSFTVIELPQTGAARVFALAAPDFRSEVPLTELPARIERPDGKLTRLEAEAPAAASSKAAKP